MRPIARSPGFVILSSVMVWLTACGSGSGSDAEGGETGSESGAGSAGSTDDDGAGGTGGGGTHDGGATGSEGSDEGSGQGSGTGGGSELYEEPEEIVGGPCADSPTAVSPPCYHAAAQEYCRLSDPSDVIMAVCSTAGRDQCEVIDECEPGWHACTATDYVARGGRDVVPDFSTTNRAWLAACVQDLGDSRFRNQPCSYCGDADFEPVVQWWCDGEVVYEGGMAGTTLGVVAGPECMRVGSNLPANGAYWSMAFASGAPSFVMCCLDAL